MKATLFDFDGVLVDSEPVHLAAFREIAHELRLVISDEDYAKVYIGLDDIAVFRALLTQARHTVSPERVRHLADRKKRAFMGRFQSELRVFEGAATLVKRRARLGPVGVVSGALEDEIRYGLARMGVTDDVAFIVSAEACRACKPDPEGYRLGVAKLPAGARPVVIEDTVAGIRAGKGADLRVIAVAHSHAPPELLAAGADRVYATMAALARATDDELDGPP